MRSLPFHYHVCQGFFCSETMPWICLLLVAVAFAALSAILMEMGANLSSATPLTLFRPSQIDFDQSHLPKNRSVAVFMQLGRINFWPELWECLRNVALADAPSTIDLYISFTEGLASRQHLDAINQTLQSFSPRLTIVSFQILENRGADIGAFLHQLGEAQRSGKHYAFALKLHSKSKRRWRHLMLWSLCPSPEHVDKVFRRFRQPQLGMLGPYGLTFDANTQDSDVYSQLLPYLWEPAMPHVFNEIYPGKPFMRDSSIAIIAGSFFWARYHVLRAQDLVAAHPRLLKGLTYGYATGGAYEHSLERLIPSMVRHQGYSLGTIRGPPGVEIAPWETIVWNKTHSRNEIPIFRAFHWKWGDYSICTEMPTTRFHGLCVGGGEIISPLSANRSHLLLMGT